VTRTATKQTVHDSCAGLDDRLALVRRIAIALVASDDGLVTAVLIYLHSGLTAGGAVLAGEHVTG
jgi:hypothetical protein